MCIPPVCPEGTAVDASGTEADIAAKNTCSFCLKGYYFSGTSFTPGTSTCKICRTKVLAT